METKHAELVGRALCRPGLDKMAEVTIRANLRGEPVAEVVVTLRGRPPLRVTLEEVR